VTPRTRTVYRCTDCGGEAPKWAGRCTDCGAWNTLVEEVATPARATGRSGSRGGRGGKSSGVPGTVRALGEVEAAASPRLTTGMQELDFVLGGGIVPGSMILIGGEPGIGKSTLLLQVAARLTSAGAAALYVSGEESPLQVRLRADRLAEPAGMVLLLSETSLETILATAEARRPAALIVDSIQTVYTEALEGAPGNVGQVRECAARLMRFAKESGTAVIVIGHVTKGGGIAGPKTLEHIVDTVLYFEGEGTQDHRILRATKNRFGGVDEIGVFRMTQQGLSGVENPSALFVGPRDHDSSGTAVAALLEGTRPLLVEIQALAARAGFGTPQRVANGFDGRRLAMLLAVLEKRAGIPFGQLDVFVNVAGGLRIIEPAGDLAVAAALASSVHDRALPRGAVFIGEVGLGGEIRPVAQTERRVAEAERMGLRTAYISAHGTARQNGRVIRTVTEPTIGALLERLLK
jgi:DNA repair protein RadA/Sms